MSSVIKEAKSVPLASLIGPDLDQQIRAVQTDSQDFQDLCESVKRMGILEPLVVTSVEGGNYKVVAGNRRFQALNMVSKGDLTKVMVPIVVVEAEAALDKLALASIENAHRENLSPAQWAEVISRLKKMGLNQERIAKTLHKSPAWVSMVKSGGEWKDQRITKDREASKQSKASRTEEFNCPSCAAVIVRKFDPDAGGFVYESQESLDKPSKPRGKGKK